jgi:hypothetical protein
MFKVGDIVRRKVEYRHGSWRLGTFSVVVSDIFSGKLTLSFEGQKILSPRGGYALWEVHKFELADSSATPTTPAVVISQQQTPHQEAHQGLMNKTLDFLSGLNLQDQPISVQRKCRDLIHDLMHATNPTKANK